MHSGPAQGFESWVKNCLGSAKPEIVQNVLAVLDKECFESPADLAEFGDRPAELAKLGNLADFTCARIESMTWSDMVLLASRDWFSFGKQGF